MHFRKALVISSLALLSLFTGTRAMGQSATSGAIQGQVTDQGTDQPLVGVAVVVTSPSLQGTQSAITDDSGQYKITNLPPGTYVATFYYSDITIRRTNVVVSINKTTPVYVKVNVDQAGGEVIIIEARAPSIDPTSTNQGITLDQDYTRNIPVPGRTFEDALGAAAGTAGDAVGVSFSGSTSLENSYVVDGVNTTGLTYGTVGTPLFNDFIEQIEIITGGYNAEYGRSTGGVVNVVTKSGSNEFHGTVFSRVTPGFLEARRQRTPTQATSIDADSELAYDADFGFDLGGPIVMDKVWFYVGFAPRLSRTHVDRVTKRRTDCRQVLETGELSECDPQMYGDGRYDRDPATGFYITDELDRETLNSDRTEYQLVSKVNFAVAPEHQGQVSLFGVPVSSRAVGNVYGEPQATRLDTTQLTTDLAAKWTSKLNDNKTEVEAVLGWHRSSAEVGAIDDAANALPRQNLYYGDLYTWGSVNNRESMRTLVGCETGGPNDPYPGIINCPDDGIGYRIGGPGGLVDDLEQRYSARLGMTQRIQVIGNHEVKGGVDFEDNRLTTRRVFSGGTLFDVFQHSSFDTIYAHRWVRVAPRGSEGFGALCGGDPPGTIGGEEPYPCEYIGPEGADVTGRTLNWSTYLRDSWQILPNLTLNMGLRYEEQRLRFAEELQGTVDPFTGREFGTNAMLMRNMWAPRVGLIYDWTKEGRSKVYGHWGRFYESIPMNINDRAFGGETRLRQAFDPSQCGPDDPLVGGSPSGPGCLASGEVPALGEVLFGSGVLIAPGIKPQYLDEWVLGTEYEVLEDLRVGAAFKSRSMGRVLEDVSVDNAHTYILANPGEWSTDAEERLMEQIANEADPAEQARLQAELEQYRGIRMFDKPRRDYRALELSAVKRFSRSFFLQTSYTYSRTRGNYPGLFSADNSQVDPNISSQYDLIELLANRDGPLPQDRPHYFKLDGYYKFDFERAGMLTTGARFRALSGTPVNALGRHYLYGPNEAFLLPRGAMGRTNFEAGIDLHIGYGRALSQGMSIEVFTDVFNVFNRQGQALRDARYTDDAVNPIVGGTYEDLIWAKSLNRQSGSEPAVPQPVSRNPNFLNTTARYAPLYLRLGARLTF
jgi:hypothetical protein